MDISALAELCAPNVGLKTLTSIVSVESSFNPYAIGVVGGRLARQPKSLSEAVATADMLSAKGYNYSVGLAQINQQHFGRFGFDHTLAFDPCRNLQAGGVLYDDCFNRAGGSPYQATDALSCYYSGNFKTGYHTGYVARVLKAAGASNGAQPIPVIATRTASVNQRQRRAGEDLLTSAPVPPTHPSSSPAANTALLF